MNLSSVINHLAACLVQEIQFQQDNIAWTEAMEQAVQKNDSLEFEALVAKGAELCKRGDAAARKRERLVSELGKIWGVAAEALTLGGVVRRVGPEGARLGELRSELRTSIATVMKRHRRLSALIGMHSRINGDVMQTMLGCDTQEQALEGGTLVNAEA